jgi:hypothetical protein
VKGALSPNPSAQDYYSAQFAGLSAPSSTAVLFGYAAGIDVQRLSASVDGVDVWWPDVDQVEEFADNPGSDPRSTGAEPSPT